MKRLAWGNTSSVTFGDSFPWKGKRARLGFEQECSFCRQVAQINPHKLDLQDKLVI